MAELKTKKNDASVEKFINSIKDEQKQKDSFAVVEIMRSVTKEEPKMWGSSIIGFGNMLLKYPNGRELDWMRIGFSPRKQNLTFYVGLGGDGKKFAPLLKKLGKYKTGKGCLYINKLAEVDTKVLREIIKKADEFSKAKK